MNSIKDQLGLKKRDARKKQAKITKEEALEFLPELKKLWHKLGQLHLRLFNGVDRNQPVYMTKPEAYEAMNEIISQLNNISEKYFK